jgi:spermidine dehydrogenase
MTPTDRELGMHRSITRRDFLNGVSIAVGGTVIRPSAIEAEDAQQRPAGEAAASANYPPALTGMRGSGPGSMDVAHAMRDGQKWDSGEDTGESYDLIVVGGGMSGLAAAYFFRKKTVPDAKILILDNHDDFGGHARRNEFTVNGRLLIAKGGTSYIDKPWTYTAEGRDLLKEIGIDFHDPTYKRHADVYRSLGLKPSVYFDKETFGADKLVVGLSMSTFGVTPAPPREMLEEAPLSESVRRDLIRLWTDKRDYLAGQSTEQKLATLKKTSYANYLLNIVKVDPDLLKYFHPLGQPPALTTETTSAWWCFHWGHPGFDGLGLEKAPDTGPNLDANRPDKSIPTTFHFPEGNGGVARLLVRSLIPEALPARSMADAQMRQVRYARLDDPRTPVRLRMNSTVVRVRNNHTDPAKATETEVIYVRDNKPYRVRGKGCVLACYNSAIPYLVPELPEKQKAALHLSVRSVMLINNVAVSNWKAFEKLGVSNIVSPGSEYPGGFDSVGLMGLIDLGAYRAPRTPSDPTVLILGGGVPFTYKPGMTARDMLRATRAALYETTFETFERNIRTHLARVLGDGGFDPARDIKAITINRWGHGMTLGQNFLFDPDWTEDEYPWVVGRKRFGRIAIANSDADGICLTQAAFDQAHRAVDELMKRQVAWWNRV